MSYALFQDHTQLVVCFYTIIFTNLKGKLVEQQHGVNHANQSYECDTYRLKCQLSKHYIFHKHS